jgi:LysR family transcriptional regulator, hydrogen peroxide-inducible genes activator
MNGMNLGHLRFVHTVAELGSFSRAAEKCNVTQSSLSNAVSQVEDQLGDRIFSRTTRKVETTAFGERMLPLVADVLRATDDLAKGAREYLNPAYKMIRIGLTPLIDARTVGTAVDGFRQRFPDVDLIFKECYINDLYSRLNAGALDFAFGPVGDSSTKLGRHPFYDEELLYLPSHSPIEQTRHPGPVRLEQVADESFALTAGCGLADTTQQLFRRRHLKLRPYPGQALSYRVLEDWSEIGVAAAILPESKISPNNNRARRLMDSKGPVRIGYEMAWNRKRQMPNHVREFLDYFRRTAKGLVRGLVMT